MFDTTHDTKDLFIGQFKHRDPPKQVYHKPKTDDEETFKIRTVKTNVTKKVIDYRRTNNLTQQQLAQKLNVKVDVIKQIEQGTLQNPNPRLLNKIQAL